MEEQDNMYTKFNHKLDTSKNTTLDDVRESSEISWVKSIGECESFIMMSMFQHHVALSQVRSLVLGTISDAVVNGTNPEKLTEFYEYANNLVCEHEDRMNELKAKFCTEETL